MAKYQIKYSVKLRILTTPIGISTIIRIIVNVLTGVTPKYKRVVRRHITNRKDMIP